MLKLLLIPLLVVFGIGGGLIAIAIHKRARGEESAAQQYQTIGDMVLKEGSEILKYFYTFLLGVLFIWVIALAIGVYLLFGR